MRSGFRGLSLNYGSGLWSVARCPPTPGREAVKISHCESQTTPGLREDEQTPVVVNRNITLRIFVIYTLQCAMYICIYV